MGYSKPHGEFLPEKGPNHKTIASIDNKGNIIINYSSSDPRIIEEQIKLRADLKQTKISFIENTEKSQDYLNKHINYLYGLKTKMVE